MTAEWGRPTAFVGGGGSIPVATLIKQKLGIGQPKVTEAAPVAELAERRPA